MSWRPRLVNVFRAERLQDELDEELRFHLEAAELVAKGWAPGGVAAFVVGDVVRLVAIGLLVGGAAGYAASGAIASLLFAVRPSDLGSFAGPALFLLAAAVLAAWPAARRAARLDPMVALRCD